MDSINCLRSEVSKLLRFKSADGIARKLRKLGIKGKKGSVRLCPLNVYLQGVLGVSCGVRVDYDNIQFRNISINLPGGTILTFLDNFDNGLYPDLIAREKAGV